MLINKILFYAAVILLLFADVLSLTFPNKDPLGVSIFTSLHIPIEYKGLQFPGITSLLLFFSGLILLVNSLEKYILRITALAVILVMFLPSLLIQAYQSAFAKGIYALSYNHTNSHCQFGMRHKDMVTGTCKLPFVNHSRKEVTFTIEFYEEEGFKDKVLMDSLMNYYHPPYQVVLKPKERKTITIHANVNVAHIKNYAEGGESNGVNIIIRSGKHVRKL